MTLISWFMQRSLCSFLVLLPCLASCAVSNSVDPQARFRGIGLIMVVDAVPDADLRGVKFYDDRNIELYSSAVVAKRNRGIMPFPNRRVPLTVRVQWRENPKAVWGKMGGIEYEGPIAGDYTIPIAERIPEAVLQDIRRNGGGLRLKFRLKPDGVLFGWDIERDGGGISKFDLPSGDFLETKY